MNNHTIDSPLESQSASQSQHQSKEQSTLEIQQEIADLQDQLLAAQARLNLQLNPLESTPPLQLQLQPPPLGSGNYETLHSLLILSDSALPLGSFAFSSGLESYLAHTRFPSPHTKQTQTQTPLQKFTHFLHLSLASYAAFTLPFLHAAYLDPSNLLEYDDALDAATICTVARRASVAQGRALLGVWERSFHLHEERVPASTSTDTDTTIKTNGTTAAIVVLKEMSTLLKTPKTPTTTDDDLPLASAHHPPLFALISLLHNLSLQETSYIYLLSHVKALLSAAVRASIFGPYMAQKILAGEGVREGIRRAMVVNEGKGWEEAGQVVPVLDLWVGRHECLYSRIFNS